MHNFSSAEMFDVVRCEDSDLASLRTLLATEHDHVAGLEALRSQLANGTTRLWIVRDDTEVAASLEASVVLDEMEIVDVLTAQAYRRRGLARALMQSALEHARSLGVRSVFLEVRASNAPAQALYSSLGFGVSGTRRSYYANGEDALLMALAL